MRRVPNERRAAPSRATPGLLPDATSLERARWLSRRFPEAHLREVTLVRAPAVGAGRTWLALESMQVTGSFKVRGALLAVEALLAGKAARGKSSGAKPVEIVAASAGNHGIGVAYAAKVLGAHATIVVPLGAPHTKTDKIVSYGATIVHAGSASYDDAEAEAIELARARGVPFLSPYDDLDVLVGNGASLAFEIVRALGKRPDVVHCPLGGGGLAAGLVCGFAHDGEDGRARADGHGGLSPLVWGVQGEVSCAFAQSLEAGAAVTKLPPAMTFAEGLEGGISERAFERARATVAGAFVATEAEIQRAMRYAVREMGLALEGSAAVALAPTLAGVSPVKEGQDAVIVLTGRNVDPERLAWIVCYQGA